MKKSRIIYALILVAGDVLAIIGAFTLAYVFRVSLDPRPLIEQISAIEYITVFVALLPIWLLIMGSLGLYSKHIYESRLRELWRLALASFLGMLVVIGFDYAVDPNSTIFPARLVAVYAGLLGFGLLALNRQILWQLKKLGYRFGLGVERSMIIGSTGATADIAKRLSQTSTSGYEVVAIVGDKRSLPDGYDGLHFSSLKEALSQLQNLNINTVIQTQWYERVSRNQQIQAATQNQHSSLKIALAEEDLIAGSIDIELFQSYPVISVSPTPLLGWGRVVKRLLDVAGSTIAIILFSPLMLLAAALTKLTDPDGPVLFKQKRLTRADREFENYKFRSMKQKYSGRDDIEVFKELDRPELIEEFKKFRGQLVSKDPRVTIWGRIMRATSIDELPQLFNVLIGDISLVGPRTIRRSDAESSYRDNAPLVLSVKSGITGLAQVSGRTEMSIEDRVKLDLYYVQNWSIWLDIKILFKTIWVVVTGAGAR